MKHVLFTAVLLASGFTLQAQTSQPYNRPLGHIEFLDAKGQKMGYAKENRRLKRLEFYTVNDSLIRWEPLREEFFQPKRTDSIIKKDQARD